MIVNGRYCSVSKAGLETGNWICDWCRIENQRKTSKTEKHITVNMKEATRGFSQCTLNSPDNGLEFLIKAVLSSKDEFFPPAGSSGNGAAAGEPSPTADCGSNCSSSVESEKVSIGVQSASCGLGDASSSLRERRVTIDTSISDEEGSIGTVQVFLFTHLIYGAINYRGITQRMSNIRSRFLDCIHIRQNSTWTDIRIVVTVHIIMLYRLLKSRDFL